MITQVTPKQLSQTEAPFLHSWLIQFDKWPGLAEQRSQEKDMVEADSELQRTKSPQPR